MQSHRWPRSQSSPRTRPVKSSAASVRRRSCAESLPRGQRSMRLFPTAQRPQADHWLRRSIALAKSGPGLRSARCGLRGSGAKARCGWVKRARLARARPDPLCRRGRRRLGVGDFRLTCFRAVCRKGSGRWRRRRRSSGRRGRRRRRSRSRRGRLFGHLSLHGTRRGSWRRPCRCSRRLQTSRGLRGRSRAVGLGCELLRRHRTAWRLRVLFLQRLWLQRAI